MILPENWRDLTPNEQIRFYKRELRYFLKRDTQMQKLIQRLYDL